MLSLSFDGQRFVIAGDALDRDIVKTIAAVKADGANRWTLPATIPTAIDAKICVEEDGGVVEESFTAWLEQARQYTAEILKLKDAADTAQLGGYTLRPDQEADAAFLAAFGSGMVLHVPRKGKTNVLFRALDQLDAFPALIATRDSVTLEIDGQARIAFPDKTVVTLTSGMSPAARKKALAQDADIYIIGKKILDLHSRLLTYGGLHKKDKTGTSKSERERAAGKYEPKELDAIQFKAIVIDEAHSIQDPMNAVTRAAWNLGDKAPHRFVLTATPAANKETEWWGMLRFCYPALFPNKAKWTDRYINMQTNFFGIKVCRGWKVAHKEDWDFVFSLMHVRRDREGQGAIKERRMIPVELTTKQAKAYNDLLKHGMAEAGDDMLVVTDNMSLRHRLRNVTAGTPKVVDGEVTEIALPSPKIDALLDVLQEREAKTIVFAESRLTCDLVRYTLPENGYKTVAVLGGMKPAEVQAAKKQFQEGDAQVIVINAAGSEGLELSAASRTVFLERSDSLVLDVQAEDRNMSANQKAEVVEVIDIYARGTKDEEVIANYERKDKKLTENLDG